jgi:hypothetical protein
MTTGNSLMIGVLLSLALAGSVAEAQPHPAAVVLEVEGTTVPALRAYREISPGTTVTLGSGARVVLLHYQTCTTVTVVGGTVALPANRPPVISGAGSKTEASGHCPRRVAASASAAATLFRSISRIPDPPMTSTRPTFLLIGERADVFSAVQVLGPDRQELSAALHEPKFQWPHDAPPLGASRVYELILVPARPDADPLRFRFRTAAKDSADEEAPIVLLVDR